MSQANQYTARPIEPAKIEAAADRIRRLIAEINEHERGYFFRRFLAGNCDALDLVAMQNAALHLERSLEVIKGRMQFGDSRTIDK